MPITYNSSGQTGEKKEKKQNNNLILQIEGAVSVAKRGYRIAKRVKSAGIKAFNVVSYLRNGKTVSAHKRTRTGGYRIGGGRGRRR